MSTLPQRFEPSGQSKKEKSTTFITSLLWWIQFKMSHRSLQCAILLLFLSVARIHVMAKYKLPAPPQLLYNFDPAPKIKLNHRSHNLPNTKKRIVQLIDGDVTKVYTADSYPSMMSPPSQHPFNVSYNPLPHLDGPILKAGPSLDRGKCQAMAEWQTSYFSTCNTIHESTWGWEHFYGDAHDVAGKTVPDNDDTPYEMARLANNGTVRHVWMIREFDGTKRALKTLRASKREFDLQNLDRHRRDAVALERLTSSPLIVDIYGYCANSALYDWGEGGDLLSIFTRHPDVSESELLKIAYNISMSIAHSHYLDERGRPTMVHADIKPDQFLYQDGYYRLTDFNRVHFLMWNDEDDNQCGFKLPRNGGKWRSPEEYTHKMETEKVDVFALGNVLYFLLTRGATPFEDVGKTETYRLVSEGKRPILPNKIADSDHVFHQYMIQAIEMAYTHRPSQRPGAFEIAEILKEGIAKL